MSSSSGSVAKQFVVVLILLAGLVGTGTPASHADDSTQSTTPSSGHEVFQNKGCVSCHAVYGKGGDVGPDLGKKRFYGTRLQLAALMWNHLPKMLERMQEQEYEFPSLSSDEMGELLTYLCYQRYAASEGNDRTGRKLLREKKCVVCHEFGGEGGDVGPDFSSGEEYLSPLRLVTSMWNHGPDMMKYFEEQKIKRPVFKRDEIVDLAAGIRSYMRPTRIPAGSYDLGDPSRGMVLVQEKGCTHCHAVDGKGGDIGPDFRSLDFKCSLTEIAGRMWNHGPRMWESMEEQNVAFPVLTQVEMADVLAYLFALALEDPPGDPRRGARIVENTCSHCHGESSRDVAPELESIEGLQTPLEMIVMMWNHAPDMRKKQIEKDTDWPKLDSRQAADLFAYLSSAGTEKTH